jgi:hypothetical protein
MTMKKFFVFLLVSATAIIMLAGTVSRNSARKVAVNFYYERVHQPYAVEYDEIGVDEVLELKRQGETLLYAINISRGGYVLVSAYNGVRPVPGYSFYGSFQAEGMPPQLEELIGIYMEQIAEASLLRLQATEEIKTEWERLSQGDPSRLKPLKDQKSVEPLLTTTWNQGQYYNEMCPADPAGPGGHCYAGCVATALGQVVNYFRWPETGTGSYSYSCPPYGTLSADYENTTYEWDKMEVKLTKSNLAVALLLYHLGIACDMVYGPNGSGMYNHKAAYALRTFFKYSPETVYVYRDSTTMDWDSLLVSHLDRAIPMYYAGWSLPNVYGHAFVCDGYQDGNYYHFNWGWGGSYDGYFYTDNLSPGGSNFNLAQEVIINAFPDTINYSYPYYCQGNSLLDGTGGTIDDGSGPVYDYQPATNCSWLIAPADSVEYITLEFLHFNTAKGDILSVYDGETTAAPLLGSFQGDDLPDDVSSGGDKMLITFVSSYSGGAPGWLLSYSSKIPVYCSGMTQMIEQSGYFSDGSGPGDYHNNTACMWMLDPPGASELTLFFTSFETEEAYDLVKVFDLETQQLLAEFSGNTIPGPVTSPSGRMFVTFSTNYTITAPGWEAWYETDLVGLDETKTLNRIEIYPNPAREKVNLSWMSAKPAKWRITLRSMTGRTVAEQEIIAGEGCNRHEMDVSLLPAGMYLLEFSTEAGVLYKKVLVR